MQDNQSPVYPSLSPEQKAKVDAVVDLMFSQNPSQTHPVLLYLREQQLEATARMLLGVK